MERFNQFSKLKNDFENQNFTIFEEIVNNFGRCDDEMRKSGDIIQMYVKLCPAHTKNLDTI